jgi:hypothetical protein
VVCRFVEIDDQAGWLVRHLTCGAHDHPDVRRCGQRFDEFGQHTAGLASLVQVIDDDAADGPAAVPPELGQQAGGTLDGEFQRPGDVGGQPVGGAAAGVDRGQNEVVDG